MFLEILPPDCPLNGAKDISVNAVYRIVGRQFPVVEDFHSLAASGKAKPPTVDDCRWASCSLFKSRDKAVNIAQKLAKTRIKDPFISLCDIKAGCGKSFINSKNHVDFWPYSDFDVDAVVIKTEKL